MNLWQFLALNRERVRGHPWQKETGRGAMQIGTIDNCNLSLSVFQALHITHTPQWLEKNYAQGYYSENQKTRIF